MSECVRVCVFFLNSLSLSTATLPSQPTIFCDEPDDFDDIVMKVCEEFERQRQAVARLARALQLRTISVVRCLLVRHIASIETFESLDTQTLLQVEGTLWLLMMVIRHVPRLRASRIHQVQQRLQSISTGPHTQTRWCRKLLTVSEALCGTL